MLYYALTFFIFSLVAAIFGFGGLAAASAGIAQICFFIFIALFVISLFTHIARRGDKLIK